mmetsp:Transcript_34606/g.75740  ORF Transcript_34606/g.75740 Transcript_34606/m.75740 type:complete len:93 (+) Transcript_34606:587-865(+)
MKTAKNDRAKAIAPITLQCFLSWPKCAASAATVIPVPHGPWEDEREEIDWHGVTDDACHVTGEAVANAAMFLSSCHRKYESGWDGMTGQGVR